MDGGAAPIGNPVEVDLPANVASQLSAYSGDGFLVFGPRGWNCTYTVGHDAYIVVFPGHDDPNTAHPMIRERFSDVGTPSNAMETIGLGGQLFPKILSGDLAAEANYLGFSSPKALINSGRIIKVAPTDHLKYLNDSLVEYVSEPGTAGIGSQFLGPWRDGISPGSAAPAEEVSSGFAGLRLVSEFLRPADNVKGLTVLGIRLPDQLNYLSSYILDLCEHDFEKDNHHI